MVLLVVEEQEAEVMVDQMQMVHLVQQTLDEVAVELVKTVVNLIQLEAQAVKESL